MAAAGGTEKMISNGRATLIGTLWVNIPVFFIIFGGWAGIPVLALTFTPHVRSLGSIGAALVIGGWIFIPFAAAWTWWSIMIPKWRIWALRRTDDWPSLEHAAIAVGLIWNPRSFAGRIFTRTEYWTAQDRRLEADLRLKHPRH